MKPETAEAYERLVSTFVAAIEASGADVPESTVEKLASEPLAACEELNEFALSCGAVSDEVDAALAAIYESMDAADARGPVDEDCVRHIAAAWTSTHVERPIAEPEPEPEAVVAADADEPAEEQQTDEKPQRRRGRKAKEVREEDVEPGEPAAGQNEAKSEGVDVKPGRRSRAKAKAAKAEDQERHEEQAEKPAKSHSRRAKDVPSEERAENPGGRADAAGEGRPDAGPAAPAPANPDEETLGVEQAVAILGVSRPTIYKLIESGELPAHKKGRSWRISAAAVTERAAK